MLVKRGRPENESGKALEKISLKKFKLEEGLSEKN